MSAVVPMDGTDRPSSGTGRPNNWWAFVLVLFVEASFFGSLMSAYLFLRYQGVNWMPAGSINLNPVLPGVNTIVLLVSSVAIHKASAAIRHGRLSQFQRWLPVAMGLGFLFLALQGVIFLQSGFTPFDRAFGSIFYTLTGFHGLRIMIGLGLMLLSYVRSLRGQMTPTSHYLVSIATLYWHFLDVVWVILFVLLYLL